MLGADDILGAVFGNSEENKDPPFVVLLTDNQQQMRQMCSTSEVTQMARDTGRVSTIARCPGGLTLGKEDGAVRTALPFLEMWGVLHAAPTVG